MRGHDEQQGGMFSYISPEKRVPQDHPLRRIRGMNVDDEVWDVTVFTKNRERLIEGEIAKAFFDQVLAQAAKQGLLSDEHFTVDGTLIEAWANRRSFQEKNPPPTKGSGSKGEKLLRDTHESKSDPESRLYKKSAASEVKPSYLGHVLMENRNGLVVQACVTPSGRKAEREAAEEMVTPVAEKQNKKRRAGEELAPLTLAADKSYQAEKFIKRLRELQIVPHIAEYDKETTLSKNWILPSEREDPGFAISQGKRKLVEKKYCAGGCGCIGSSGYTPPQRIWSGWRNCSPHEEREAPTDGRRLIEAVKEKQPDRVLEIALRESRRLSITADFKELKDFFRSLFRPVGFAFVAPAFSPALLEGPRSVDMDFVEASLSRHLSFRLGVDSRKALNETATVRRTAASDIFLERPGAGRRFHPQGTTSS